MSGLTDDYFRDLPPKDRRYDTPLGQGLVFSVFPNGTKCWVLVYSAGGFARRRTLGIFPEMRLAGAQASAAQARRILEVESRLAAAGEASGSAPRRGGLPAILSQRPRLSAAVAAILATLAIAAAWLVGRGAA